MQNNVAEWHACIAGWPGRVAERQDVSSWTSGVSWMTNSMESRWWFILCLWHPAERLGHPCLSLFSAVGWDSSQQNSFDIQRDAGLRKRLTQPCILRVTA